MNELMNRNNKGTVRQTPQQEMQLHRKVVYCIWNVMAHTQKPDFIFWHNGWFHLNWRGRQCSRILAAKVCASAVVMLDTPRSEVVRRILATQCMCCDPWVHVVADYARHVLTLTWKKMLYSPTGPDWTKSSHIKASETFSSRPPT
jgi:hypothetical protein